MMSTQKSLSKLQGSLKDTFCPLRHIGFFLQNKREATILLKFTPIWVPNASDKSSGLGVHEADLPRRGYGQIWAAGQGEAYAVFVWVVLLLGCGICLLAILVCCVCVVMCCVVL